MFTVTVVVVVVLLIFLAGLGFSVAVWHMCGVSAAERDQAWGGAPCRKLSVEGLRLAILQESVVVRGRGVSGESASRGPISCYDFAFPHALEWSRDGLGSPNSEGLSYSSLTSVIVSAADTADRKQAADDQWWLLQLSRAAPDGSLTEKDASQLVRIIRDVLRTSLAALTPKERNKTVLLLHKRFGLAQHVEGSRGELVPQDAEGAPSMPWLTILSRRVLQVTDTRALVRLLCQFEAQDNPFDGGPKDVEFPAPDLTADLAPQPPTETSRPPLPPPQAAPSPTSGHVSPEGEAEENQPHHDPLRAPFVFGPPESLDRDDGYD